jgi:hypothetical protein
MLLGDQFIRKRKQTNILEISFNNEIENSGRICLKRFCETK